MDNSKNGIQTSPFKKFSKFSFNFQVILALKKYKSGSLTCHCCSDVFRTLLKAFSLIEAGSLLTYAA
jgi:hypothetical protein